MVLAMQHEPNDTRRKNIRIPTYDYTQSGAYFVTICTHGRACRFGEVVDFAVRLNRLGRTVRDEWLRSAMIRNEVRAYPEELVVMPNHVHGIVWIDNGSFPEDAEYERSRNQHPRGPAARSLGAFVVGFKASCTKRMNALGIATAGRLWQREYFEHVIRSDAALEPIRRYIENNPAKWTEDRENPDKYPRSGGGTKGYDEPWLDSQD